MKLRKRIVAFVLCIITFLNCGIGVFASSLSQNEMIPSESVTETETVSDNAASVLPTLDNYESEIDKTLDAYYEELNTPSMMSAMPYAEGSPVYTPNLPPALMDENNPYYWFVAQHKTSYEMMLFAARGQFYLTQNNTFNKYSPYPTLTFKYKNGAFYPCSDSDYVNASGFPTWKLTDINFRASNQDIKNYDGSITYILATESNSPDTVPDEPIYTVSGYPPLPYQSLPYWFVCRDKRTGTINLVTSFYQSFGSLTKEHDKNGDMVVYYGYEFYELANGKYWMLKSKTTSSPNIPLYIDDVIFLGSNVNISRNGSLYYSPNTKPVGDTTLTYAFTIPSSLAAEGYTKYIIIYAGTTGTYYAYVSKEPLKMTKLNGAFHITNTVNYRLFTWDKNSQNWSLSTTLYPGGGNSSILSEMNIPYGIGFVVKANYDIYKYHNDVDKYLWFDYQNSRYLNEAGNVTYTIGPNGYPVLGGSSGEIGGGSGSGGGLQPDTDNIFLKPIYEIIAHILHLVESVSEMRAEGKNFFEIVPNIIKEMQNMIVKAFTDKISETITVVKDFFALVGEMRKEGKTFFEIIPELIGLSFDGMKLSLKGWFTDVIDLILKFKDRTIALLEGSDSPFFQLLGRVLKSLDDFSTDFAIKFYEFSNNFKDALGKILRGEISVPEQLKTFFSAILDKVKIPTPEDIGAALVLPLKILFEELFVPTEDIGEKTITAVRDKFAFFDSILTIGNEIERFFNTTDFSKPPVIKINLAESKGKIKIGGESIFIDMSWYAPYKQSGDLMISGFLWIVFLWNTMKNIPSIIGGTYIISSTTTELYKKMGKD